MEDPRVRAPGAPAIPNTGLRTGRSGALARETPRVAALAVEALYRARPEWTERWGARGRTYCLEDNVFHLEYLGAALEFDSPATFSAYVRWLRDVLVARGVEARHLQENLRVLREQLPTAGVDGLDVTAAIALLGEGEAALA